jgi:hypothetical protein
MNPEVIKSAIRWTITAFGAALAGWFAHSGYITADQALGILNSPAFASFAFAVVSGVVGLFVHTQANAVAVVATIAADPTSPVVGVITTNTMEGRKLAASLPAEVAPANSAAASSISLDNVPPLAPKTP